MALRRRRGKSGSRRTQVLDKLGQGTYGTQGERIDWTYWDEEILAAANLTVRLFTNPLGAGGKTLDQTNLRQAGMIPQGQKMVVKALKVIYVSETTGGIKATAADVQAFYTQLARTTLQIKLSNKETMGEWTLQELFGIPMLVAVNPALTLNMPFLNPRFHGVFPLNRRITLAALTPFYVELTHAVAPTAATIGDRFKVGLSGILTRVS